jgi:septal ring factor EnvC (AmiA/AmiB activator)
MVQTRSSPPCAGRAAGQLRLLGVAVLALAGAAAAVPGEAAPSTLESTRARLEAQQARERALSGRLAEYSTLIGRLGGDIAVLQGRQRVLESRLAAAQAELARVQRALRRERARLAALRARLAYSRAVLARRLVEVYEAGKPDLVTVVLTSRGWVDLLERSEFMRRINEQDRAVIIRVRAARDAVQRTADRLAVLEAREQQITDAILDQRNQVVSTRLALDRRLAGFTQARAEARSALRATTTSRIRLESRLQALEARYPDAGSLGASGGWAIPWSIVNCESGGRNTGPNQVGASGYYQIIPSTWRGAGGRGPAAHLAPKSEQDRIAHKLWNHGRGASNWVCAGR